MQRLIDARCEVLVETGGHIALDKVPKGVKPIVDVKCPGSGESARMHWANLDVLPPGAEVKFVIQDRADFDYARGVVDRYHLGERAHAVLFSPVFGVLAPDELARWILDARVPARLQIRRTSNLEPGHPGRVMADRAVVLLSGGLDSTTAAALARREGWELYALTLRYGNSMWPRSKRRGASRPRSAASVTLNSPSISARLAGPRSRAKRRAERSAT